jgi:membrane protein insertase Oxa1/YidC/SpoIIIJ
MLLIIVLVFVAKATFATVLDTLTDDLYREQEELQIFQAEFEAMYEKLKAKHQEGNQLTQEETAEIQSLYDELVIKNMYLFKKAQNMCRS